MDQMADEITLRVDMKGKERVNSAEENAAWVTGGRTQTETQANGGTALTTAENESGEINNDTSAEWPGECKPSSSSMFSLKMYLRRSPSTDSSTEASLSHSQQTSTGVDCAGIILNCLFCQFYDMMLMLPGSCKRLVHSCCPNSKPVPSPAESTPSSEEDFWTDVDCGLFASCHDANDCLELAMEVSELCYH